MQHFSKHKQMFKNDHDILRRTFRVKLLHITKRPGEQLTFTYDLMDGLNSNMILSDD